MARRLPHAPCQLGKPQSFIYTHSNNIFIYGPWWWWKLKLVSFEKTEHNKSPSPFWKIWSFSFLLADCFPCCSFVSSSFVYLEPFIHGRLWSKCVCVCIYKHLSRVSAADNWSNSSCGANRDWKSYPTLTRNLIFVQKNISILLNDYYILL